MSRVLKFDTVFTIIEPPYFRFFIDVIGVIIVIIIHVLSLVCLCHCSVVLTAAHCSPDLVNSNSNSNSNSDTTTEVLVGAYYANGTTAERRICIKHVVHPNFTSVIDNPRVKAPLVNDFALCLLDRPVELEMKNYLLLVNRREYRPTPGSDVIAIGLGRTSDGRHAEVLQEVPMKVLSNESCYEVARDARKFQLWQGYDVDYQLSSDEILCAKDSNDDDDDDEKFHVDRDTCRGDSGGPLLQRVVRTITANNISTTEKNEEITDRAITTRTYIDYYHVGVISYGYKCATINLSGSRSQNGNDNDSNSNSNSNMYSYPSVYARTSSGFSFIRDVVCGTNIDLGLDEDAYFCKNKEDSSTSTSSATVAIIITNNTKRGPTKSSTSTTIPTPTMTPTKIESSPSTAPSSTISSLFSQSWCSIFFDC